MLEGQTANGTVVVATATCTVPAAVWCHKAIHPLFCTIFWRTAHGGLLCTLRNQNVNKLKSSHFRNMYACIISLPQIWIGTLGVTQLDHRTPPMEVKRFPILYYIYCISGGQKERNGRDLEQLKAVHGCEVKVRSAKTLPNPTWSARNGKAIVVVS